MGKCHSFFSGPVEHWSPCHHVVIIDKRVTIKKLGLFSQNNDLLSYSQIFMEDIINCDIIKTSVSMFLGNADSPIYTGHNKLGVRIR